jgi:hypothetical protein
MTLTHRYRHLAAQHAYERDVAARGLPALFAPYLRPRVVFVPEQRRPVETTRKVNA